MENSLLVGLSRQMALARELDVIANNMANVNTSGFKARSARFNEFVMPVARGDTFIGRDQQISYVIDKGTPIDLTQGTIQRTGNPLDVALSDGNFLAVQTPRGERYTRAGSFAINARGDGGPIRFGSDETDAKIAVDGTVSSSQGVKGKLRQVRFANPAALSSDGENLFASSAPAQPAGPLARLEVGSVESSNVKAIVEMTRLMEVQRNYQNVANMMSRTDELRTKAISRLADQQA